MKILSKKKVVFLGFIFLMLFAFAGCGDGDRFVLNVEIEPEGAGSVHFYPQKEAYPEGTEVEITAVSEDYWNFKNWTGDKESEEETILISVDSNLSLQANFEVVEEESGFAGGVGSAANPYLVGSPEQLSRVREERSKNFQQIADINLSQKNTWEPIGKEIGTSFSGVYDGKGYKITNLIIDRTDDYSGLFGIVRGEVKNVGLEKVEVNGGRKTGGLAGKLDFGQIENSYVLGKVSGDNYTGGLVGRSLDGEILTSFAIAEVEGSLNYVGGLAGSHELSGKISNSYAGGKITGNNEVGGFVGRIYHSPIKNSYSIAEVQGDGFVGAFFGYNQMEGNIEGSYYNEDIAVQGNEPGLFPKTTEEMLQKETFEDWAFDIFWAINEGESYPYLQWQEDENIPVPEN